MPTDTSEIRRSVRISDMAERFGIKLEKRGREFWACCPFHKEDTSSFSIFTAKAGGQRFQCFGCDEHGDIIHFVQGIKGVSFKDAIEICGGVKEGPANRKPVDIEHEDIYACLTPLQATSHPFKVGERTPLFNPKSKITSTCRPLLVHEYRDSAGILMGLVLRLAKLDGGKETPFVRFASLRGRETWARWTIDKPRPLYGLDQRFHDQVIVVEGEKCKDALAKRCPDRTIVAWPGGTNSVEHIDWSPLDGKDVILWADHDAPGTKAMVGGIDSHGNQKPGVAQLCKARRIRVIDTWTTSQDLHEKGWDCANLIEGGATADEVVSYIKRHLQDYVPPVEVETPLDPVEPTQEVRQVTQIKPERAEAPPAKKPQLSVVTNKTEIEDWPERSELICDEDGVNKKLQTNWTLIIETHPRFRGVFRLNNLSQTIQICRNPPWSKAPVPRDISEADYTELAQWFETMWRSPIKTTPLRECVVVVAKRNVFDPLTDYVNGLEWDGVPRLDRWLHVYAGTADNAYTRLIGRLYLVSCIARALEPGCKVDTMLILESTQGAKKSSIWVTLFSRLFFSETMPRIEDKDAMLQMQGLWGIEFSEMHAMGTSRADAIKAFLAKPYDKFRPPYGHLPVVVPRRTVFCGTINPDGAGYLNDGTGNRRYWPATVIGKGDIPALERDRDQLFAEARHVYEETHRWWVDEDSEENLKLIQPQQKRRFERDPWQLILENAVNGREQVGYSELTTILGLPSERQNRVTVSRLAAVMKLLHFERSSNGILWKRPQAGA